MLRKFEGHYKSNLYGSSRCNTAGQPKWFLFEALTSPRKKKSPSRRYLTAMHLHQFAERTNRVTPASFKGGRSSTGANLNRGINQCSSVPSFLVNGLRRTHSGTEILRSWPRTRTLVTTFLPSPVWPAHWHRGWRHCSLEEVSCRICNLQAWNSALMMISGRCCNTWGNWRPIWLYWYAWHHLDKSATVKYAVSKAKMETNRRSSAMRASRSAILPRRDVMWPQRTTGSMLLRWMFLLKGDKTWAIISSNSNAKTTILTSLNSRATSTKPPTVWDPCFDLVWCSLTTKPAW